ncbi:hypothetical protein B0H17DRAFT_1108780 [Mycena rosella]|uniref:F-box domain-containing protein n=1 Tax=Mycena rosella TaxID=1033263 RepID=A0AAD7BWI8_MYCRO|nr:hypothetical protein B0H17DRAFT_1108780 [Mycena rosella]
MFWASLVKTAVDGCLPRLMRLEWHESELDRRFYGSDHIDRLREIVSQAPNLRYLFLSSDRQDALANLPLPPSIHTLQLNRSHYHPHNVKRICTKPRHTCDVPKLRNLILHTMLPTTQLDFIATSGRQLRVLELAFSPQVVFSTNQMQRLLSRCSKVEELAYYIGAPEISPLTAFQCPSVKRVRLKIDRDEWNPCKPVMRSQVDILEGTSFPELQEIILHDTARWLVRRDSGRDLLRRMLQRGYTVKYDDGSSALLPT